jgi:DNA polymerase III alpha subunit
MNIVKATESDGIELLYRNKSLYGIPFDNVDSFNRVCDALELDRLSSNIEYSQQFNIPQHYLEIDVESYIRSLVKDAEPAAQARVEQELDMFRTRNLYPILQLLIYIVDTMRKHNIVWGVGRGSSVASYCLYLLGVHKIDSLKYNLDIREFLK